MVVSSGKACLFMRDEAGGVVCSFLVHPDREIVLLGSALTSRSPSVRAMVHSGGTHRVEQLGVTFADTGVLSDFENACHEAMALELGIPLSTRGCSCQQSRAG